jgi:hypothetical protein
MSCSSAGTVGLIEGKQRAQAQGVDVEVCSVQAFLRDNNVRLILRSHEGPDARAKRPADDRMPSIDGGFCVDHDTPRKTAAAGMLRRSTHSNK